MDGLTSRATMRRDVLAAGGYYSRQTRQWVIPGASHNCMPWATDTQWFASLEDAWRAAADAERANAEVRRFGEDEAAHLLEVRP